MPSQLLFVITTKRLINILQHVKYHRNLLLTCNIYRIDGLGTIKSVSNNMFIKYNSNLIIQILQVLLLNNVKTDFKILMHKIT